MNEKISFNVDHELMLWLEQIQNNYKENGIVITNRSDLLRTIIMREWFRVTEKMK